MTTSRHLPWLALLRLLCVAGMLVLLLTRTENVCAQTMQRIVVYRIKPEYPALAMRMHISGIVLVYASVQPNGTVSRARAASGHAFLQGPAEQAVRRWRFSKAPISTETTVEVQFALDANQ